jgi:hypothetical protein
LFIKLLVCGYINGLEQFVIINQGKNRMFIVPL